VHPQTISESAAGTKSLYGGRRIKEEVIWFFSRSKAEKIGKKNQKSVWVRENGSAIVFCGSRNSMRLPLRQIENEIPYDKLNLARPAGIYHP
jgi:hypothetical protein